MAIEKFAQGAGPGGGLGTTQGGIAGPMEVQQQASYRDKSGETSAQDATFSKYPCSGGIPDLDFENLAVSQPNIETPYQAAGSIGVQGSIRPADGTGGTGQGGNISSPLVTPFK